ncbi:hypothetical protein [Riemerella anatipestifer]|uniref:hypothetical protein n=1 Tax=Riemerella anatipestifer TaxID=34085 RepID=UPI0001F0E120|nr:hypothetical protein [Riemerella anatipestifer]EFT37099.1 hypothetical protein RAYM_01745 [Riemerella anatipestifer RA-YM]QXT32711.1 hypothetical protein KYF39_07780 [Riemerella anatipestifer RA-YM]
MSFGNENLGKGSFSDRASKKVEASFTNEANQMVDEISSKGKKIAEQNEKVVKDTLKIGAGCIMLTILSILGFVGFIIYLIVS